MRLVTNMKSYENSIEISSSLKSGEFLDYVSDYKFLKEDSAPLS